MGVEFVGVNDKGAVVDGEEREDMRDDREDDVGPEVEARLGINLVDGREIEVLLRYAPKGRGIEEVI